MNRPRSIPTLDGWRALAVLGVILYHGKGGFFTNNPVLARLCAHGILGVDVFFAISGFLICGLLLQEYALTGAINLRRFYIRRVFRILPPYYFALACFCVLGVLGVIRMNFRDLPSCLLFYRNYLPLGVDEGGGFYTAHFWTLAVEEHFYLLWPSLLILAKPKRIGKVALVLALMVFAWRVVDGRFGLLAGILPQANLATRTDTRIDSLLWGCLAAIYFPQIKSWVGRIPFSQLWLVVLGLLGLVLVIQPPGRTLWHAILLPALVLSTVTQPASLLGRFLEWRPVRWIGGISYSLYLWQELFLPEISSEVSHTAFRYLQRAPWNLPSILAFACLSRYLVEIPLNRLGHRLSRTRVVVSSPLSSSATVS